MPHSPATPGHHRLPTRGPRTRCPRWCDWLPGQPLTLPCTAPLDTSAHSLSATSPMRPWQGRSAGQRARGPTCGGSGRRLCTVRRSDPRSRSPPRPATAATPQPFGPADQLAQFSPDNLKTTTLVRRVSGTHARRTATAATKRVMQAPPDPEHLPLTGWSPTRSLWRNGRLAASPTASPPARVVVVLRCATVTPGARRPRCRTRYWRCDRAAERRRGAGPRAAGGGARAPPYCACCRLRACRRSGCVRWLRGPA